MYSFKVTFPEFMSPLNHSIRKASTKPFHLLRTSESTNKTPHYMREFCLVRNMIVLLKDAALTHVHPVWMQVVCPEVVEGNWNVNLTADPLRVNRPKKGWGPNFS